ncbi:murein L,D-transpeptidase YcbB/YkuD [Rhodoligotrophos appendicifer]|uniref:L,D-transpeptidase family protein n=1 Tax=Rhodoligotrophos appendicifer TaxID=987056 RepID=UPI00118548E6|nr:L,D-transpeptidase family protein [Rhodoligotrophos appendicifer]
MKKAGVRLGVLACTMLVALPIAEASAEITGRSQNFTARNFFERLFNIDTPPPQDNFFSEPGAQGPAQRYRQQQQRTRNVVQPRREDNVDPEGDPEPAVRVAPDIAFYVPAPLVPLTDQALTGDDITDPVSAAILAGLRDGVAPALRVPADAKPAILAFYKDRDFIPAWTGVSGLNGRAATMLKTLAAADDEGLQAQQYLPPSLTGFTDTGANLKNDPKALASLDLQMTVMALKYARDAMSGRVDPNKITRFNDLTPPKLEPAEALAQLNATRDPGAYLASLNPTSIGFTALKNELKRLREANATAEALPPIGSGPALKLGMRDERVTVLRAHLSSLGLIGPSRAGALATGAAPSRDIMLVADLSQTDPDPSESDSAIEAIPVSAQLTGSVKVASVGDAGTIDSTLYDQKVVDAVRAFQRQQGLSADGIAGVRTVAAFEQENDADKIEKILLNMERARWMPRDLGKRYVLVNQPAFELNLIEDNVSSFQTRVVVGTKVNQTPAFNDVMETIEFNPYWYVPRSIINKEMLPKQRRDPSYLSRNGYEVTRNGGQISVRQPPGKSNALGEMKFLFPNSHAVYLHDTPSKSLFGRDARAFSHGCVRVQNPRDLAEAILEREGWSRERIERAIAGGSNNGVRLKQKVEVHLAYLTAWPGNDGAIHYHDDVYGRDAKLSQALAGGERVALQ